MKVLGACSSMIVKEMLFKDRRIMLDNFFDVLSSDCFAPIRG
jgi:hypothetical protein